MHYSQNSPEIDTNNDNEIQISEALATTRITAVAKSITDITGIEEFKNLERLNLFNNSISNVDLSANTKLIFLNLTFNSIGEIDLSSNNDLVSLSLSNTSISEINVSNLNDLELLNVNSANLSTIDVSNNNKTT